MPYREPIVTVNNQNQDVFQVTAIKNAAINNRAAPYVALALGLYENQNNPIQFAIDHLDQINNPNHASETITKISKVYSILEVYADRLCSQQIITLPQLAKLYGLAKKFSDEKIATAVLTSLTARHLAFKSEISHCQQCHLDDAKNIIATTRTYFRQEAAVDAMVYMVSSLCKEPDNYQLAANQGNRAELKKLSGAKVFSAQNQDKVNHVRLLLIAAQHIASQVEEKQLDDAYIIFTIKQELLKQGIDEKLADAVTIVCGASYFFEKNYNIPKQNHLEQAAEWLAKSEAIINYRANQVSIIKFLQEYIRFKSTTEKAITAAEQLKQKILSGDSIDGALKHKGRIAELSWKAFAVAQDYAANYYFSPIDGAFKLNRNDDQGNGFYSAVLQGMQLALKDDVDNPIHQITPEKLSKNIKELVPSLKGIIIEQFNNIIRNDVNILSVPAVFVEELCLLKSSWQQRENLSVASKKSLDQNIANYLKTISTRYIEFINSNPAIGCDIELKIIAHCYNLHIKQHSHLIDNYGAVNPEATSIVHIFYAQYQGRYYSLVEQKNLKLKDEQFSRTVYIEQAASAAKYGEIENYLKVAISILALHNPVIWQENKSTDPNLLKETIKEASEKINVIVINALEQHGDQLIKKYRQLQLGETKEVINDNKVTNNHDVDLSFVLSEQLSIIDKEAAFSMATLKYMAANLRLKNPAVKKSKDKTVVAEQMYLMALDKYDAALLSLYRVRQEVYFEKRTREMLAYNEAMLIKELEALGVANLQAYRAWWQNVIKEQRDAIEVAFTTVNSQIDKYIVDLTKAYEQKLTEVDNHWAAVLNKAIQDYNYHQKCVEEAQRTAKRKCKQKMYRNCGGMLVAAFVAPYLAGSMFAAAGAGSAAAVSTAGAAAGAGTAGVATSTAAASMSFGYVVTTGVIAGGISSAIAGNNILKGAAIGGLFAGFGFGVDSALGEFIKSSELLRSSLSIAATASLSTAIYGGKLLDNVLSSVGANVVASLLIPLPKFDPRQGLNQQQLNAITNRQVMRAFTRGMTASLISKDHNLGMSLITAGMGGLQTWATHQANMFVEQRRAIEQQQAAVSRQAITYPQDNFRNVSTGSSRTGVLTEYSANRGRTGGYKIDLSEIEHPCASAFRPKMPAKIPRIGENYTTAGSQPVLTQSSFASSIGRSSSALDFFMPAAYADEFVTNSTYNISSSASSIGIPNYLEEGLLDSLLIGSGRAFIKLGQGIKQGCYIVGEKVGLVQPDTSDTYTQQISRDKQLYNGTPVAQSISGKVGEFGTDMLLYSFVPAGTGVRGWRLAASSAAAGGFIGGLQPTDDGLLFTRFQNAGIDAVVGGIAGPLTGKAIDGVKGGMLRLFDARKCARNNFGMSKDFNVNSTNPSSSLNLTLNDNTTLAITQKGLDRIEAHLDHILLHQNLPKELQIGERAMLERLRSGNRSLQDIEFYLHELKESAIFRQTGELSSAHKNALQWRSATERDLFHQSVIDANKEIFPIKWRENYEFNAHPPKPNI